METCKCYKKDGDFLRKNELFSFSREVLEGNSEKIKIAWPENEKRKFTPSSRTSTYH